MTSLADPPARSRLTVFLTPAVSEIHIDLAVEVALLLACAGRHVLVVDWTSTEPDMGGRLGLLPWRALAPIAAGGQTWAWRRCVLRSVVGDLVVAAPEDAERRFTVDLATQESAKLRVGGFDDVLIVVPQRRPEGIEVAVAVADVAVLAAPSSQVDDEVQSRLEALSRRRSPEQATLTVVAAIVGGAAGRPVIGSVAGVREIVEVPSGIGAPNGPVTLLDREGPAARACALVARAVADLPADPAPVPEPLGTHFAQAVGGAGPGVEIAYLPPDRAWADRIKWWLRDAGVPVRRYRPGGADRKGDGWSVVAVLPTRQRPLRSAPSVAGWLAALPDDAVGVRVGEGDAGPLAERLVDLTVIPAEARRVMLLGGLDRFGPSVRDTTERLGIVGDIPYEDPYFVGRDTEIEAIRDVFDPFEEQAASNTEVVLVGEAGVGKSSVAAAFAYRFRDEYAGVLWVNAQDAHSVSAALAALSRSRGWVGAGPSDAVALQRLHSAAAVRARRWLVVLDNVRHRVLQDFPIDGIGDVLITTTSGYRPSAGTPFEIPRLSSLACAQIAREIPDGYRGLTDVDGVMVAASVGRLPLSMRLAAAFVASEFRRLQEQQVPAMQAISGALRTLQQEMGGGATGEHTIMTRVLSGARRAECATGSGRIAMRIAEFCAFLSPDGISVDMLRLGPFVRRIGEGLGDPTVQADELEVDRALATGHRIGLFVVDWGGEISTVRMHRVLQESVRALLAPDERAARHADVLAALATVAEAAPTSSTSSPSRAIRVELQRHFRYSGADSFTDSPDLVRHLGKANQPGTDAWRVRRWVVEQVTFARRSGEPHLVREALAIATAVEQRWLQRFPSPDPLRYRLSNQIGGLTFDAGTDPKRALAIDDRTLVQARDLLGPEHPRTLLLGMGYGGDLRTLGHFDSALPEDESTWYGLRRAFGDEHPYTLAAGSNLAESRFLSGDHRGALELQRSCHASRARVQRRDDPWFRSSLRRLGVYLRENGLLPEAGSILEEAEGIGRQRRPVDRELLLVRAALDVLERRAGRKVDIGRSEETLNSLAELLGADHPDTISVRTSHAVSLARTPGRAAAARALASASLDQLRAQYAEGHPAIGVVWANLALIRMADGDVAGALADGERALQELTDTVGEVHPWRLAARLNLARAQTIADDPVAAAAVAEIEQLCGYLAVGHPVAAATSAATVAAATGSWPDLDIDPVGIS